MSKKSLSKIVLYILPFIFIFVCLSLNFYGGQFSSSFKLDEIASEQSKVVKENNINYLGLYIENTKDSQLPEPVSEFYAEYGTFRQERANFIPAVNIEKDVDVYFNEIDNPQSLSFFYFGPIRSTYVNDHYKDFNYPFEYMFESVKIYPPYPYRYVINISKAQADKILDKRSLEKTEENYQSLLHTYTSLSVDGVDYDFMIGNIFYNSNYYSAAVKECLGEYVMVSYYFPDVLTRSNMYLLGEYDFQNSYYMKRIMSIYDSNKNPLKVNHNNLTKPVDDEFLTSFYYTNIYQNQWLALTIYSLAGVISIVSILFICAYLKLYKKARNWIPLLCSCLIPFAIFKIICLVSGSVRLYSTSSTNVNFYFLIAILLIYLLFTIVYLVGKAKEKRHYEINI